jgi:hypothetical protein
MRKNSSSENKQSRDQASATTDYPRSEPESETKSKRAVSISDAEVAKYEFDGDDQVYTDEIINERISEIFSLSNFLKLFFYQTEYFL